MNCWKNVADKFNMSPEDAEKNQGHSPFFSQQSYGNRMIVFFRDSGDPSDYMETGLKEQWGKMKADWQTKCF